jgi:methylthioribulose-1-phosphate dehydratase
MSLREELRAGVAELGRAAYARGWALGTSGNFSAVVEREPLGLLITASGMDKGRLTAEDVIEVDGTGEAVSGGRPSAETALHVAVVKATGAGAVSHTHSIWSTLVSDAARDGVWIEGYEMLKGLEGVRTHEHREWLPVIENVQDWAASASAVVDVLNRHPRCHGFLIRRHGLYTWGSDLRETRRHLEILEFLLEVVGRTQPTGSINAE